MSKAATAYRSLLRLTPFTIAAVYAVIAFLWLIFSDGLLDAFSGDQDIVPYFENLKDGSFILVTMLILFALLQRHSVALRNTRKSLRESRDWLRDISTAASDWLWETDENMRFSYLSERFYELTRIPPEQVLGHTRWELAGNDPDREKWQQHRKLLESQRSFRDFIYRTQVLDERGHPRYFKISGKPVYDAQGEFKGYRGIGTDITEQMEAEMALQESQRTLETLMSNLPGMAYRCRSNRLWSMDFVSTGCIKLTGYHPDELTRTEGLSFADLIHLDDRNRVWEDVRAAVREDRPYQVSYRINTARGEEKWVWEQGCASLSAESKVLEGLIIDITERKRAEEERARMRLYLKNIIDSMPSILLGVDPEGRITEWNKSAEQASGVTWEQARGRFFGELFPQLTAQLEQVRAAIHQYQPFKTERVITEVEGDIHYADIMVYPLIANGTAGAVIRMDDVTTRVRIEEMMAQTEKMLSVGGLAAGMAHEINNPLGTILQGAQNIQRRLSSALPKNCETAEQLGLNLDLVNRYLEQRGILRFLEGIREAGTRAAKIVSDMLAFSRRSESHFSRVDLSETLETAVRLAASDYDLKKKYDFKQIRIERDYDPTLNPVPCDKTKIEQVILNLVKNAAQAMAGAHISDPTITLRTRREPDYARIEVIDNGPGMDEKARKRAFEPFFTTKEVGVGTGLGLSVSYFIITEQHRGTLSMASAPGQGARFIIRLPLARE